MDRLYGCASVLTYVCLIPAELIPLGILCFIPIFILQTQTRSPAERTIMCVLILNESLWSYSFGLSSSLVDRTVID